MQQDLKPRRHLPIPGTYNIRDLGGYRIAANGPARFTNWRRFLRADSPHRMEPAGVARLMDEGVATVVDLRTRDELAASGSPFAGMQDVAFVNIPLFDQLAPASLGQAKAAVEDPLLDFYLRALETRHDAIRDILAAMAEAGEGAVMFNCTAGKDRTGLVAALLLGIAGVHREDIIADYALTAELIPELVAEFLELSRQNGGDVVAYERMLRSPPRTMTTALASIDEGFGGVEAYLDYAGLPAERVSKLRTMLTGA